MSCECYSPSATKEMLQNKFFKKMLDFIYIDFTAPYLPPLCVFHCSLSILNVVIQDKRHSFQPVKYNLRKQENTVPRCQRVNNGQL